MKNLAVLLSVVLALFGASTTLAATTLYTDSSNFGGFPNVVNGGNAVGFANGASAFIPTFGWIAFQENPAFTTGNIALTFSQVTGTGTALFYYGQSNGAGGFSALNNSLVTLTVGTNILSPTAAQSAFCAGLGGCDVFIVQAWGGGTTFRLDGTLGPSMLGPNPEPSAWALMILGFVGVAWRLKQKRRSAFTPTVGSPAFA